MSIKPCLTKKGNVSKSNNEPSIIIKSNSTIDKPIIKDSGQLENVEAIKTRQKKLKVIKDKLTKLPNKHKTTKEEFVAKVKAIVAPKIQANKEKKLKEKHATQTTKRKLVASDKHKSSHSTYQNLQHAKTFIDAIKKPFIFYKHYDDPTPKEYTKAYGIFKYAKDNIHYVGHNVGTLSSDMTDEFKTMGNYAIECWNKVRHKLKDAMYKTFLKQYNLEKKQNIAHHKEKNENEKKQVADWNLKYKTDPTFKKKHDDFKKKLDDNFLFI